MAPPPSACLTRAPTRSQVSGPNVISGQIGGVLLPDGRVVFVPANANTVGLYDPSTNTFTSGPNVGSRHFKFCGGVLLPNGRVVFVPAYSTTVGLFDPSNNKFTSGPNLGSGEWKFEGGVLLPDGRVVFVPYNSASVGVFDPRTSATWKPAYTLSQPLPPSWNVALLPYYNKL